MINVKNLKPLFENVKSYYNKARIITNDDTQTTQLKSYNTIMLEIDSEGNITRNPSNYNYTNTTLRHCKEFLKQYANIQNITKKDILNFKEF